MTIKRASVFCLAVCVSTALLAKEAPPTAPYSWPAPPEAAAFKRASTIQTHSGLVLLEKRCELTINSYFTGTPGVRRDEFIRLLVMTEEGSRRASLEINDDRDAKIESIEARTVGPDGRVTPADPKNDIHRADISDLSRKDVFASVATVNFPAPVKGSVLDLHVITFREGAVSFMMEPVGFEETPSLSTTFTVHINGGLPGYRWSILVSGRDGTNSTLENKGLNTVVVTLDSFLPKKKEPHTVPYYQRQPTLLCYIDLSSAKGPMRAETVSYHSSSVVDPQGRLSNFEWRDDDFTKWWVTWFKDEGKFEQEFIAKDGPASDIEVKVIAPESLPLGERVQRLYRYVQTAVKYNPDAEDVRTIGSLMKKGESASWQGTLLLSYLLGKAGIPHQRCYLMNRFYIQFSPIATNSSMYGFYNAVTVEIPDRGRVFLVPGDFSLPFACLDDAYQNSLAFWREGESMKVALTPANPPGMDTLTYRYAVDLTPDGSVKGKLWLQQTGAPGRSLSRWSMYRSFRNDHPDRKDKTSQQERTKAAEDRLREECWIPGPKLLRENIALGTGPKTSTDPVELTCSIQVPGMAQSVQEKWLLDVNPVLAGYTNVFTDDERATPVWYDKGGRITVMGTIKLPAGAKVIELPKPESAEGPDGTAIAFRTDVVEVDGAPAVALHLTYDQPLVVGSDRYKSWQYYQATLSRLAESRCVITLPTGVAAGALE